MLAVAWSIKKLRLYIEGYHFTMLTDHTALKWLKNLKDPTGRLTRWAIKLQQWDFEIVHWKGSQHQLPDALSRIHDGGIVEAFEEIRDPGYLRLAQAIEKWPRKYVGWQVGEDATTSIGPTRCWIRWTQMHLGGSWSSQRSTLPTVDRTFGD